MRRAVNVMDPSRWVKGEVWLAIALLVGLTHHVDHVLRFDHSGWPFRPDVTPFTWSLLVYPVALAVLLARGWPRLRAALAFALFAFPTAAHMTYETPVTQYRTWAGEPQVNLLGVTFPLLGIVAGTVTILLSLVTFVMFLAFLREARRGEAV